MAKKGRKKISKASLEKRIEKRKKALEPGEEGTETSADTNLVNAMETNPEFFKDPLIGQTVGKCQIQKYIGEGRTSVVYQALYEPLRRTVALKVLQPSAAKFPAVVKVFQKEGRAVAALDHENILKIYDVGQDGSHHYLVLELLKGKELLSLIDPEEGMPVAKALDFTSQAAAGLAAAHRKNLVHRDIKPQNLVVEPGGKVKLVDFGLAAEAEGAFSGGRLGTPHYMPPEVCRGEAARTASDIYSMGITLYHMLVGKPPYSGRKHTDEIIQDHLKGKRLEPEKVRREIPKPVGDLIRKMTRQDPATRPTAREVREEIEDRLRPEKLAGRGKAVGRKAVRRGRKKEAPIGMIVLIGVAVLGLGGLLTVLNSSKDAADDGNGGDVAQQPPAHTGANQPDKPPDDKPAVKVAPELAKELKELIREAKTEERAGNLSAAHHLWLRVLAKAPPETTYHADATAAAQKLKEKIERDADAQGKERNPKAYITSRESEEAGRQFADGAEARNAKLVAFELDPVKVELDGLFERTKEGSPERGAIEIAQKRLAYLRSLLSVVEARAASLPDHMRQWMNFDIDAEPDVVVTGANEAGIHLKDETTGSAVIKAWAGLDTSVRIDFLEQIRSKANGMETLWLAYYCQLAGDARADIYFSYAESLDPSPEMLREIKALQGG